MKLILFLTLFLMISCNEEKVDRNPFLQEISFDERINLSLPTFDNLRYQGGSIYWQNGGIKGLNLFNLSGTIMAWEAVLQQGNHLQKKQNMVCYYIVYNKMETMLEFTTKT